jgi:hypothetical protein
MNFNLPQNDKIIKSFTLHLTNKVLDLKELKVKFHN